ncbi:MAG: HupE/UreJ family protein [Chitinophagaceae bacterium]|nr:MAG: HupE/UreJ family protein [Chitinophagaceae bacterium]
MNDFIFFLEEGWKHIISVDALDHQLFVLVLTIIYGLKDWKKVLILVTAFTIGHSITLALSALNIISISSSWVEFLIPLTICITAAWNIMIKGETTHKISANYFMALIFGLIHGLGFANTIRMLLASNQSLVISLLGFNVGLELGQIVIVILILLLSFFLTQVCKIQKKWLVITISLVVLILAGKMAFERTPF